jgi:small subunit ribosomal protein S20
MNKKEKNKKQIKQNLRNRLINRHYKSTIKNLIKNLKKEIKVSVKENDLVSPEKKALHETRKNKVFSMIDKATKKKVIHKNKAARKKSRITKFLSLHLL